MDAINELGLDDFLAKLKSVTGRAPAAPRQDGADARVGRAFAPEKAEYEYELSRLDEEIAVLKAGGTAAVSRSVPPLAQRSAAPLPLPPAPAARSPRDPARAGLAVFDSVPLVNFDGTLVFSGGAVVDHAGPPRTVPDPYGVGSAADGADDSVQRKIMRMQEALRESRQMRASLAITDPGEKDRSGGYDAGPILERATRNVTRAVRAAPPGDGPPQRHATHTGPGAPLQPSREMNALRELNHGQISPQKSPPPQLLRKKQQVLQQQFPAPISGPDPAEPMSEQELLSMVSRMYEGDHDLQQRLWEMISDGAIRTPRELRAFAEGVRREAYRTQLAQGVSMHAPRARSSGAQHPMLPQPPPGYPAQPPTISKVGTALIILTTRASRTPWTMQGRSKGLGRRRRRHHHLCNTARRVLVVRTHSTHISNFPPACRCHSMRCRKSIAKTQTSCQSPLMPFANLRHRPHTLQHSRSLS